MKHYRDVMLSTELQPENLYPVEEDYEEIYSDEENGENEVETAELEEAVATIEE